MRLQRYLNEKYFDSLRDGGIEVFVNPSKKEIKDAISVSGYGFRFLVDFKKKLVYVWSDKAFHEIVMDWMRKKGNKDIPNFDAYWYSGVEATRFFTGSVDKDGSVHSDHTYFLKNRNKDGQVFTEYKEEDSLADIILAQDMGWLNKYLNINRLRSSLTKDVR
jgi:hypothetical protein